MVLPGEIRLFCRLSFHSGTASCIPNNLLLFSAGTKTEIIRISKDILWVFVVSHLLLKKLNQVRSDNYRNIYIKHNELVQPVQGTMCRVCQIILKVYFLRKVGISLVMLCFLILGLLKFYPKEHVDYQDTQGNDFNQSKLQLFTYPLTLLSLIFFFDETQRFGIGN